MSRAHDVTEILQQAGQGGARAADELFSALYRELRAIAANRLQAESPDHTLQATALVHEAYVRLIDQTRSNFQDRLHFLAVASRVMRHILVDHARARGRRKRGGGWVKVPLDTGVAEIPAPDEFPMLEMDAALDRLGQLHPEKARVVELRFFGGLTSEECAKVVGVSVRTVARHWDFAQAWLYREMSSDESTAPGPSS